MDKENVEPFGIEWRKEMQKMTKDDIINLFETVCKKNIRLENLLWKTELKRYYQPSLASRTTV